MSINTYPDVNPGYRVWYFDPDTYQPMDYEQYNIDLRKANGGYYLSRLSTDECSSITYLIDSDYYKHGYAA